MLGTNDSKHPDDGSLDADNAVNNWQHKADYVPDYEALIAEFRQANPKVKVYRLPAHAVFSRTLGHQRQNHSR